MSPQPTPAKTMSSNKEQMLGQHELQHLQIILFSFIPNYEHYETA